MGVESNFYIMPEDSGYRPDPAKVCELVRALRAAGFLCDPRLPSFAGSAHRAGALSDQPDYEGFMWKVRPGPDKHAGSLTDLQQVLTERQEADVVVRWPNSDLALSGLKYPLTLLPGPAGVYYDIEMQLAAQTVYHTSEIIDPFEEIHCQCGGEIREKESSAPTPLYDSRLPNQCPACHAPMNYAVLPLTVRDGFTGAESQVTGGAVYRFAIVVDCGKYWPEGHTQVMPDFLGTIEGILNIKTRVLRDFY